MHHTGHRRQGTNTNTNTTNTRECSTPSATRYVRERTPACLRLLTRPPSSNIPQHINPQISNLKATLSKTLDMPPMTKTASGAHDVDPALAPIETELQQALDALQKLAADKDKPVHASTELRAARETLGHVDSLYHEGAITLPGVEGVPAGQVRRAWARGWMDVAGGSVLAFGSPRHDHTTSHQNTTHHAPHHKKAKLAEMLAQGHELLRTILENQVDYYKASRNPHHVEAPRR